MRINTQTRDPVYTHEGARAKHIGPLAELRRSVCSALLWENEYYEDGQTIAERVVDLCQRVNPADIAALAIEARGKLNLRHMPLLLAAVMATRGDFRGPGSRVSGTVESVIQRADEMGEFLAIFAQMAGKTTDELKSVLPAQVKRGVANAMRRFDHYQLAKYNSKKGITLKDVILLCHPKPKDEEQSGWWKAILDGNLGSADTWEVGLSGGADKRETWERLLREEKFGYLALLKNLRGMMAAGVDEKLVNSALLARKGARRVLPFRYIAAARACPQLEPAIDTALQAAIAGMPVLPGKTLVLVDVSGSMNHPLSKKSDLTRMDAGAALASIVPAESLRVFSFSNDLVEVPPRRSIAGVDAITTSQHRGGTYLGMAVQAMNEMPHDRLIVITDEQSHDPVPDPVAPRSYLINVASTTHGIGYGKWTHVDGFSENVLRFISEHENLEDDHA